MRGEEPCFTIPILSQCVCVCAPVKERGELPGGPLTDLTPQYVSVASPRWFRVSRLPPSSSRGAARARARGTPCRAGCGGKVSVFVRNPLIPPGVYPGRNLASCHRGAAPRDIVTRPGVKQLQGVKRVLSTESMRRTNAKSVVTRYCV